MGGGRGGDTPIHCPDLNPKRFSQPISMLRDDCQAIPFIKFIPSEGKFELNPEAGEFLQTLKDVKLGVVAVCGRYRTGKSYLLNKLFVETYFQSQTVNNQTMNIGNILNKESESEGNCSPVSGGFQVSPTINPCTKGLWIWKKVVYSDQNDCPMIVIDTEGLGAFDEDENHDAKIFLLALLLSSLIIYNSVGTIDETALNNLSLVINLSKKIQLKNRHETPEDIDELASIFPSFLWVLRDFTLKLQDADGNRISSKQYLENALKEQKGCSESVEQKNRIRRLLKHFFQERDCCTLIRPTEKEKDLQDLAKFKDSQLRKEFVDQMNRIKHKVMTKVKVKVMNGHQLNGPMLVELAMSYIQALNDGKVPNIESAWSNVCNFEQERAFKDAVIYFENQVKIRIVIKNSDDCNLNSSDVKCLLNKIREETFAELKKNFIGDQKSLDGFYGKLKQDVKSKSSAVLKETLKKIEEQINHYIERQFQETIEQKLRRGTSEICSLDTLQQEIDHLMTIIQVRYANDSQRVEQLYRKYVYTRIYKVVEIIQDQENIQTQMKIRLLEEKLKLSEAVIQKSKDEKMGLFQIEQELKMKQEKEKIELEKKEKILEQKLLQLEEQFRSQQEKLKKYTDKHYVNEGTQTRKDEIIEYVPVSGVSNKLQLVNFKPDIDLENPELLPLTNTQIEMNRKLYNDILNVLNNQSQQISKSLSEEFGEVLKNNQCLSKAIEQSEKRCLILEKKLQKKYKYENLIKNCQRLQCNGCNKLYTPMLFVTHFMLCKKQQQLRSSIVLENRNSSVYIQEEDKEESQSGIEDQFLAKIVDMKQTFIDLRDGFGSSDDGCGLEISGTSDEVVTIMRENGQIKHLHQTEKPVQYCTVDFKLCILYRSNIWYIQRSLQQIKTFMNKVQRDKDNSEQEQCFIAKSLLEIERNEIEENYQRISEITELFFSQIHRKIVDNQLSISKVAKHNRYSEVDDNDTSEISQGYVQEFIEFFEIMNNYKSQRNGQQQSQDDNYANNDDDVVVQMTYEDDKTDSDELPRRSSNIGAHIPSTISDLCSNNNRQRAQYLGTQGSVVNHSTIHLDGEKSANDNSLHFVSFFSVAEEMLMKNNLFMQTDSQENLQMNQDQQSNEQVSVMDLNSSKNDQNENYLHVSPPKISQRAPQLQRTHQPFGSISNRQSHNAPLQQQYFQLSQRQFQDTQNSLLKTQNSGSNLARQNHSPVPNMKSNSAVKSQKKFSQPGSNIRPCKANQTGVMTSTKKNKNCNMYE